MTPVSKARSNWPPVRLPELPNKIAALILGRKAILWLNIFGNLAIDFKSNDDIIPMQVTTSN